MTFEEAKAHVEAIIGDEFDRPIEELDGWKFGERVRVLDDDERAPEYGNVRKAFHILIDDQDCPMEIDPFNIEGAE
jgi:hypothetical protein